MMKSEEKATFILTREQQESQVQETPAKTLNENVRKYFIVSLTFRKYFIVSLTLFTVLALFLIFSFSKCDSSATTTTFSNATTTTVSGFNQSSKAINVPAWSNCNPSADTCISGYTCCVGPADANTSPLKYTCRTANAVGQSYGCLASTPPPPTSSTIAAWSTCPNPSTDKCATTGYICCVAPADLGLKTGVNGQDKQTCRPSNQCASTSTPPPPTSSTIAAWSTCPNPTTDKCATTGYICCVAPADLGLKTGVNGQDKQTCRPSNQCASTSTPPPPTSSTIAAWAVCKPATDKCVSGYTCCVAPADRYSSPTKYTCRTANAIGQSYGCLASQPTAGKPEEVGNCVSGTYNHNALSRGEFFIEYGASNVGTTPNGGFRLFLSRGANGQVASGTNIISKQYIWHGRLSVDLKPINMKGAVTAFITMSNVGDEIDMEVTGDPVTPQTNIFYRSKGKSQEELEYGKHDAIHYGYDMSKPHRFVIDWRHDRIVWSIDGNAVRTANRADTVSANDPSKTWFPNTPSQLQFSVWDTASSAPGTINWAGGAIDWSKAVNNQFWADFDNIKIECYDPYDNIVPKWPA